MSRFANISPFRHVGLQAAKNEVFRFNSLGQAAVAASAKFFAVPVGTGGNLVVAPINFEEFKRSDKPAVITAHGSPVTALGFCPHDDLVLASTAQDGVVKLWSLPESGLDSNLSDPTAKIGGLPASFALDWHPCADHVLAVGGKNAVSVLDAKAEKTLFSFRSSGFGKDVISVSWSADGRLLASLDKTARLCVGDVRAAGEGLLADATQLSAHYRQGQHALFLGPRASGRLALVGLDKYRKPLLTFWDPRSMSAPVRSESLPFSAGQTLVVQDRDSGLLGLTMRGATQVSLYDTTDGRTGAGCAPLTKGLTDASVKAMCLAPKRACRPAKAEVARLMAVNQDAVRHHSLIAPRRPAPFHPDLYPPALDCVPATSAGEWAGGKDAVAKRVSMETPLMHAKWATRAQEEAKERKQEEKRQQEVQKEEAEAEQKKGAYVASTTRTGIDSKLKGSLYRHLTPEEPRAIDKKAYWFDLTPSANLPLGKNMDANSEFWAVPWATVAGSAVVVHPLSSKGRMARRPPRVMGHRVQVSCFALGRLDPHLMVTGTSEGTAKLWRLPAGGPKEDMKEPLFNLPCGGRLTRVLFHPYICGVVLTAAMDSEGKGELTAWDTATGEAGKQWILPAGIDDIALEPTCKHALLSCKDGLTRVYDLSASKTVAKFRAPETLREQSVLWLSPKHASG